MTRPARIRVVTSSIGTLCLSLLSREVAANPSPAIDEPRVTVRSIIERLPPFSPSNAKRKVNSDYQYIIVRSPDPSETDQVVPSLLAVFVDRSMPARFIAACALAQ